MSRMRLFVVFTFCVAAASAFAVPPTVTGVDAAEIQQIIDSIYHPSTDPATAAALEQMLLEVLGISEPVIVEEKDHETVPIYVPETIDDSIVEPEELAPIDVGPAIIDESIIVEPGHNEELSRSPIDVGPAIIDESIISEPANNPPLVKVIVNVNTNAPDNAVVVEQPEQPIVVDQPVEEVVVVDQPEIPEEIIVAPVIVPEEPVEVPTPVIVSPNETIPDVNVPVS